MGNRFSHLLFMCAMGLLVGCYNPQRDLSIDPYNTPLIHIIEAAYDENAGIVTVQWEYLGQKRVENFVLQRRDISGFRNIVRSSGADAQGIYATAGTFQDRELFAGERLQYRVIAEYSEGGLVSTSAVEVPIPGAGLREVRRNPIVLAVQLGWQTESGEVMTYEVVRAPAGGDYETIFVTQDPQQTSFEDRSISDNRLYTYAIRSNLSTGVKHTSRGVRVQFYREAGRYVVAPLHSGRERVRFSPAGPHNEADMLALIVQAGQSSLSYLRHTLSENIPNRISHLLVKTDMLNLGSILPQSVDLVGPPPLAGREGTRSIAYIGGIDSIGRIGVTRIEWSINTTIIWQLFYLNWISTSSHVRLAQDNQQRFYIATGRQLRVYSATGSPVGTFDLEYENLVDIAVHNGVIWVAWANGIQRGILHFSGETLSNITWEVVLHPQIEPRALTFNAAGQIFVLDRTQIRVFRANGEELLSWTLPAGAFSSGDLTMGRSSPNLLHLSDENGEVITYVP
ncbi:MAG: hypothetical protein OXN20_15875 [Gemmatimonadota bacterium]|nr:hypothetical protein [Gemmatimonadota bacterium]